EEILHIKNYTYVMNVRTHNGVELELRIHDEVLQERVPRLSLQPLVENSFTHGLKNKRGPKRRWTRAPRWAWATSTPARGFSSERSTAWWSRAPPGREARSRWPSR